MSKIIVSDLSQDLLRFYMGKSREVVSEGSNSTIKLTGQDVLNVEMISSHIAIPAGFSTLQERTTIRVTPKGGISYSYFEDVMAQSLRIGVTYTDHYFSKVKMELPTKENIEQHSSFNPTYSCKNVFNYYSKRFEDLASVGGEILLPPVFSDVTKENFIDKNKSPFNNLGSGLSNIYYSNNSDLKSNKILNNFPFYNQLNFSTKNNSDFINFIQGIGFEDALLAAYLKEIKNPAEVGFNIQFGDTASENVLTPLFSINSWLGSGVIDSIPNYYPNKGAYQQESLQIIQMKLGLIEARLNQMKLSSLRTYEDIIKGAECPVEDVFYSFDKWREILVGNSLQSYFIPADREDITLTDTQVKYGNNYIYHCDGHILVLGNSYTYDSYQIIRDSDNNPIYEIQVVNMPSIVMLPLRMFEKQIGVLQPPPLTPEVKFLTEMNSDSEIDIYLSSNRGKFYSSFEAIFPKDQGQLDALLINNEPDNIEFRDEEIDESSLFEVYYSDKPPENFRDMTKKTEIRSAFKSTDALYTTEILPNRKVYYMFRKVNDRGFVSNPTPIYEVELILDADDAKIVVDTYSFPELPTQQKSRKFQSLFQIQPAIQHTTFDNNQDAIFDGISLNGQIENITLGVADKAVWGKKFKFRFKSTTSGKILDLNVTFRLTKQKSKEDF